MLAGDHVVTQTVWGKGLKPCWHVSTQVSLAHEHISTQGTLAHEHVSTQDKLVRDHILSTQDTQFSSLLLQKSKEDTYRPTYIQVFLLCLKSNDTKTMKCSSWKNFFSSAYVTGATCFDKLPWMFFNPFDLIKVCCYPVSFFNHHVLAFWETSVLKKVSILHDLCNEVQ